MKKLVHYLEQFEELVSAILLPVMVIIIFLNTLGRYTALFQIFWAEELARYLMIWSVYLGSAAAAAKGEHFAVDVVVEKLPKKIRLAAYILEIILNFVFCGFVLFYGFKLVKMQTLLGQVSATLRLPMSIMYSAMPVCGLLMLLHYTYHVYEKIKALTGGEQKEEVK